MILKFCILVKSCNSAYTYHQTQSTFVYVPSSVYSFNFCFVLLLMTSCTTHHCMNDLIIISMAITVCYSVLFIIFYKINSDSRVHHQSATHGATWPMLIHLNKGAGRSTELCRDYRGRTCYQECGCHL